MENIKRVSQERLEKILHDSRATVRDRPTEALIRDDKNCVRIAEEELRRRGKKL